MKRFSFVRIAMAVAIVATLGSCKKIEVEQPIKVTMLPAPTGITVGTVTAEEASFSWMAVEGAYSYTAELKTSPYGAAVKSAVIDAVLNSVAFAGLEPGTEYYFHVRANDRANEAKNSYFSEFVSATTETVDPQYAPLATPQNVYVDAMATTLTTLTFHWDVVENAASYSYKITWTDPVLGAQERAAVLTGATITSTLVEGLTQGTTYRFQVRANPADGSEVYRSSNYSAVVTASTIGQLAAPVITFVSGDATINSVHFTWTAIEGAAKYVYTVSESDGAYGSEVTTTYNEVELTNLLSNTKYTIKVKALPVDGSVTLLASDYSLPVNGKTLNAGAPQLAVPTGIVAGTGTTQTTLVINWAAVTNAVSYSYQFTETGTETAAASNTVTISSGLTAETTYAVRVKAIGDGTSYVDSNWSEWANVATLGAPMAITVSTAAEFKQALVDIHEGGTITLNPGEYIMNSDAPYAPSSLTITKSMKLVGASTTNLAHVNYKQIDVKATIDFLEIRNIEWTSYLVNNTTGATTTANGSGYLVNVNADGQVHNLVIDNCFIHDMGNSIVRASQGTVPGVDNYTLNNNRIYNVAGKNGGLIDGGKAGIADNSTYTITNNTIAYMGQNISGAATVNIRLIYFPNSATFTAIVKNNTFYNSGTSTTPQNIFGAVAGTGTFTMQNNIFFFDYTGADLGTTVNIAGKGVALGTGTVNISNNAKYVGTGFTWVAGTSGQDTYEITDDPAFENDYRGAATVPLTATFKPTNAAYTGLGDPRWSAAPSPVRRK